MQNLFCQTQMELIRVSERGQENVAFVFFLVCARKLEHSLQAL